MILLLACVPHVSESLPSKESSSPEEPAAGEQLIIATTDYQTGALASWDAGRKELTDSLLLTSSDSVISSSEGKLFLLGRSSENTVRMYGEDLSAPEAEFSTGDRTNPQDALICGERIVVSLYETSYLGLYSLEGQRAGQLDLSAWDDGDGGPEADDLYLSPEGALYVSLNQLDADYKATRPGTLLKVDCSRWEVLDSWEVSPNASIHADSRHPSLLVLDGGNYFQTDSMEPDLDGWVQSFDTSTDSLSAPLLTEADYGANLGFVSLEEDGSKVVISDNGFMWDISCWAADGSRISALSGNLYVSEATFGPDGQLWLAIRPGFSEGSTVEGVVAFDPASCHAGKPLLTSLPPSGLAWR